MQQISVSDTEEKVIAILKILGESPKPLGSITIARKLEELGFFLSERAVRYHLRIMDERGYTQPAGHGGRMITEAGRQEIKDALAVHQIGFVNEKLELLAYQVTFDPEKRTGQVPINTSLFKANKFKKVISAMKNAFQANLCVSDLVAVAEEGKRLGSIAVPEGYIGLATVCSVTINGVLLKAGIPTEFRFGGVLEIKHFNPRRFVAIINYDGTSVDPSEQYIRARMTSVGAASRTGNGKILGVFRTIPAMAKEAVEEKLAILRETGIGGVYRIGEISQPICQIPVSPNRVGVIQLGGLNPVAAAVEDGVEIENIAESGLIEYDQLQSYWQL